MKKAKRTLVVLSILLLLPTLSMFAIAGNDSYKIGDVIGEAVYSDIRAWINYNEIASCNINGNTAICVEDLAKYNFDVRWDADTRTLYLDKRDNEKYVRNQEVKDTTKDDLGAPQYEVLYTDIKTYIFGTLVKSFNVNGKTMIYIDSLAPYGELQWDSSSRYITLFTPNHKTRGYLYYDDGKRKYFGELSDGKAHGFGFLFDQSGRISYYGGFYNDKFEGYGIFFEDFYMGGFLYRGEWVDDKKDGFGILYDNNFVRYMGQFKNDNKNGFGVSYDENGTKRYLGNWSEDQYNGIGQLFDENGTVIYVGNFSNGTMTADN